MKFFVGLHMPSHAARFRRCMVSVNRLRGRRSDFPAREWIMDSGAFTEVSEHGRFRQPVEKYAEQIDRWSRCGTLLAAVAQDFMCEPHVQRKVWGAAYTSAPKDHLSVSSHEVGCNSALTLHRYVTLMAALQRLPGWRMRPLVHVMPVLQGWEPRDYVWMIGQYGPRLPHGAWVGVGSVCKRNVSVAVVEDVLVAIYLARPDLRLHGFGLKLTALASDVVRRLLWSADSMAWSYAARRQGRDANSGAEAERFVRHVERQAVQTTLFHPKS